MLFKPQLVVATWIVYLSTVSATVTVVGNCAFASLESALLVSQQWMDDNLLIHLIELDQHR